LFMSKGSDAVHAAAQAQQMVYGMVQRQATLLSFLEDFRLLAFTFLAVIPLMFLMRRIRPRKGQVAMEKFPVKEIARRFDNDGEDPQ